MLENLLKEMPKSSEEFKKEKYLIKAGVYVDSAVLNTHSLADILAQIINVIILNNIIALDPEAGDQGSGRVTMRRVEGKLLERIERVEDPTQRKYGQEVCEKISSLLNSPHFKYINAFANTIKHRELIPPEFVIRYPELGGSSSEPFQTNFELPEFEYNEETYPSLPHGKVVGTCPQAYTEEVITLILDVNKPVNEMYELYIGHGDQG